MTIDDIRETRRFVVAGLGDQGVHVAAGALRAGHDLVGAVDTAPKAGRSVGELVPGADGLVVDQDLAAVLDRTRPDLLILAVGGPLGPVLDLAGTALDRGVDVLALHDDLAAPDEGWTPALDARALAGGATLLASGVHDAIWVHLPALLASASHDVTAVHVSSAISIETLPAPAGPLLGLGVSPAEFTARANGEAPRPSPLTGPLREAARRMGHRAGPLRRSIEPIIADTPYEWASAGLVIEAGRTAGLVETIAFDTDDGVAFRGRISVIPASPDAAQDEIRLVGRPDLRVVLPAFPGHDVNAAVVVSRIPDVAAARPGVVFPADLAPPGPSHTVAGGSEPRR